MQCTAEVAASRWDNRQCERQGKELRHNHVLCAQHAKKFDAWDVAGYSTGDLGGLAMARFWWSWE